MIRLLFYARMACGAAILATSFVNMFFNAGL